ncbi:MULTISPECIES: hypothetical protein, partial [unclassified Serratia (in: enterobacteria)]|uniref:hypothetical protein n=1 Tax=unclassified Serratia (in: enterobacteria) TaxID=2647522 RepID=UPI001A7E07CC
MHSGASDFSRWWCFPSAVIHQRQLQSDNSRQLQAAIWRPFSFYHRCIRSIPQRQGGSMPDKEINHIFSSLWVVFILIA